MKPNTTSFPSPADPNRQILLNLDPIHPHILRQPTRTQLLGFLRDFESRMIDVFWEKVTVESPYKAGVPYGLSCSSAGHTIVPSCQIASLLGVQGKINQRVGQKVHAYGLDAMNAALEKIKPKTIAEAQQTLTENGRIRFQSFSLVEKAEEIGSFDTFVESLISIALSKSANKRFATCCLIALRAQGWLLLPTSIVKRVGQLVRAINSKENDWIPLPMEYLNSRQTQLLKQLQGTKSLVAGLEATNADVKARFTLLCSSLEATQDLSWKFASAILFSTSKEARAGTNVVVTARIRAHWRDLCQANGQAAMVESFRQNYRECIQLRCPDDPRLEQWLDILSKECETQTSGNFEPRYQAYGHWLTWLASLPTIPTPFGIVRGHINDVLNPQANTFRRYIDNLNLEQVKNRNKPLARMADFFDRLASNAALNGGTFNNPIHRKLDAFKEPARDVQQGTKRKRLSGWVLDDLKKLIVVPDPSGVDGELKWAESLKDIEVLWISIAGFVDKVFCPILPAIIYLMLEYPLRSHQVRWLDSGELDPTIYDFNANEFVKNPSYDGANQSYGVLRASIGMPIDSDVPIDFQVAVNKVLLDERKVSNFTIPYVTPQTLWVIRQILIWQAKYGVSPKRVKEVHEPTKYKNRNQSQEDFYPDICSLFRYPLQQSYFPPSLSQLTYFWGAFCEQWDQMNENWRNPSTGETMKRPGVPVLSKRYREYWAVANHFSLSMRDAVSEKKKAAELIYKKIEAGTKSTKTKNVLTRIKEACDFYEGENIPITMARVGRYWATRGGGVHAQSIRNNVQFREYVLARAAAVPATSILDSSRRKSPQEQGDEYIIYAERERYKAVAETLKKVIERGNFDLNHALETGELLPLNPSGEVRMQMHPTIEDALDVIERIIDEAHLAHFGLQILGERIESFEGREYVSKRDFRRLKAACVLRNKPKRISQACPDQQESKNGQ